MHLAHLRALLELSGNISFAHRKHLDTYKMPLGIVVSIDASLDLLSPIHWSGRDLEVGGIRRWIEFQLHDVLALEANYQCDAEPL